MQVLEVYHERDKSYFLLSKDAVDSINTICKPPTAKYDKLGEGIECDWTVSASGLRKVLKQAETVTDAMNLMLLIKSIGCTCIKLRGLSWQKLIACSGQWYDLKPKFREGLEERGVTDGTFILQGV